MSAIRITLSVDEETYRKAQGAALAMGKKISHLTEQFYRSLGETQTASTGLGARLRGAYRNPDEVDPKEMRLRRLREKFL